MTSRSYLGAIAFVTLCGVGVSILMFPRYEQVSLMIADDGQYQVALRRFQHQTAKGEEDLPTLVATVKLLEQNGRDREAIKLVEDYVEAHKQQTEAYEFLAQLYRHAVRLDEYLEVLWVLQERSPKESYLHDIALYAAEIGDYSNEQRALEQLFGRYPLKAQEFEHLAYFYASQGKRDKAVEVVRAYFQTTPINKVSIKGINFAVHLLIHEGYPDDAAAVAADYVSLPKNRSEYFDIVSGFIDENLPKQAMAVFATLPPAMRDSKKGISVRFELLMTAGEQKAAYDLLLRALQGKKMSSRLFKLALPLTLQETPKDTLLSMIQSIDLEELEQRDLLELAGRAVFKHEPELSDDLRKHLGEEYLKTYPALMLALSLGAGDLTPEQAAREYDGVAARLSGPDNSVLASLYEIRGMDKLGKRLLDSIQSLNDFPPEDIFNLTVTLVSHKMEAKAIALVTPIYEQVDVPPVELMASWMILQAVQGHQDKAVAWLQDSRALSPSLLKGFYDVAILRHYGPVALEAAEKLESQLPSPIHEAYVASAQVINGKGEEGLAKLRSLFQAGYPVAEQYIGALAYLEKAQPELKTELTTVIAKEVANPNAADGELRNLGYMLIEQHLKSMAEPIFLRLAQEHPLGAGDAMTLLDIWGPHPNALQASWIVEHASVANMQDEALWLRYLVDSQQPKLALEVIQRNTNDEHGDIALVDIHFQALVATKEKEEAGNLIAELTKDEVPIERLVAWAKIAKDGAFYDGAQRLYIRAMEIEPSNPIFWRELGLLAWDQGDFCNAKYYLSQFLVLEEGDFRVNYIYGELLWHDKCYAAARCFDIRAWDLIDALPKHELEDQQILAHVMVRLECYCEALELYQELLERHPLHLSLYAELGELYILLERYECACKTIIDGFYAAEDPKQHLERPDDIIVLEAVRLHLLKEWNCVGKALCDAEELATDFPDSVDALSVLAEMQLVAGRWKAAVATLECARDLQPLRTVLGESIDAILYDHSPFVSANTEYRTSGPQHEWLGRLHVEDYLCRGQRIFGDFEVDGIHFGGFVPFDTGVPTRFVGNRERGAMGLEQIFCNGRAVQGTILLADGVVGVGGKVALPDSRGLTVIAGAYHEPCWDLLQSTIQQGIRNHIGIARTERFFPRIEVNGSFTFNTYNLFVNQWAATSYQILAGVLYKLSPFNSFVKLWGRDAEIGVAYSLELEEVLSELTKTSITGDPFQPLGLSDRQAHTGCMVVSKKWSECFAMDGSAGYTYDAALHHGGAMGTFGLTYGRRGGPQARLFYYHVVNSVGSATAVDSVLFDVRTPF